jgi:3-oxoadipate CoA-transferase beta subunit
VTTVFTSLAVIDIVDGHFLLREKLPGMSLDELQALTEATLRVNGTPKDLIVPEL